MKTNNREEEREREGVHQFSFTCALNWEVSPRLLVFNWFRHPDIYREKHKGERERERER